MVRWRGWPGPPKIAGIVLAVAALFCFSLRPIAAQRDDAATQRSTAGFIQERSPYLGLEPIHPTWLRRESGQGTPQGPETRWPRFIGIGDGDFEAEDGWVTVDNSASVVKCGLTQENLATHMTEQYLVSGIRRKGLRVDADWELACQRRDQKHETAVSFALYPMRLQKADSGGIYGSCFDGGFVSLISLHPVLELYCKTGFPEYKKDHDTKYLAYKYQGWITCDTLMVPADSLTLFSLEEAISRGSYNPVDSEEWVGCSCPKGEFMFAYKASRKLVEESKELLSIEIKCAPGGSDEE
eukprot:CAMPEP_0178986686 /NCGR_PEP_ID=MMETSP0795-20121207/2840_1 /TAXON_ID=88552 /ORGANISM="Amoebophrya sp., Strain Ameob2" /LENGTH=296 /DNA_ID=CAMNT_0020677771 /DNA_START=109 /DNA_END=999 /DNA_ORIENTATION=-